MLQKSSNNVNPSTIRQQGQPWVQLKRQDIILIVFYIHLVAENFPW